MRTLALAVVIGLALSATAAAQTATRFDLMCSGVTKSATNGDLPWFADIAVDLDRGVFCEVRCRSSTAIASIDATRIVFVTGASGGADFVFDRVTGAISEPGPDGQSSGHCEKAAFSGLPKTTK
jgi:hypothetical protein